MKAKLLTMLILITGLYGGLSVNAQTQSISNPFQALESNPYLMPPTPDVAAFLNYGQYSVSQASGKVDITIPIYEIQTRDLNFPITLSYIGGGIKVTDQASWAGLGWVLNAGGVVNHTVQGLPDKNWFPELPTAEEIREGNDYSSLNKTTAADNGGLNGTEKMRDRYDYSFGHGGGTFYITSYEEYLQTPYTENKIKRLMNATQTQTAGFVITDDKGVSYYFERPENSTVLSTSYNHNTYRTYASSEEYTYNSAWYLTKIVSLNQRDSINFIYSTDNESYVDHKLSHSYSVKTANRTLDIERGMSSHINTRRVNETPILQKIVFQQGYVVFESKPDREDNRSYRIAGIKIYNSNDELIKSVTFSHSYFGGKRLKLDNVGFIGRDGKEYDRIEFEYYDEEQIISSWIASSYGYLDVGTVNPYYAQDYMGYYNGANNKSLVGYFPQDDYNYDKFAADRSHSAEHAKVHSLKSISYLTGSQVDFIYDTEDYIDPRNPAIKIKEIISKDRVTGACLNRSYTYSGLRLSMPIVYDSQVFVDYSVNVASEEARTYVTMTYNSEPLIYGYDLGLKGLYKRIEETIVDSTNPSDTILVVKTYDVNSADFVDTGYYLALYGHTAEDYSYRQQTLAAVILGEWNTVNSLLEGGAPAAYNVPGYVVDNTWEEGELLTEEVYRRINGEYKLFKKRENK